MVNVESFNPNLAMDTKRSPSEFTIHFWGVRGSVPAPGSHTVRYGGNTSCIEIRVAGKRLIFDGGTGLRNINNTVPPDQPFEACLFFTHYHWDHIQGLAFFEPLFNRDNHIAVYGQVPEEVRPLSLEQHFYERVLHINSPVPVKAIEAQLSFHNLAYGDRFFLDDVEIQTGKLNHPNGAMGYRVTWNNHTVVYCTDTEHYGDRLDPHVLTLAQGADVLIYDAMYTNEEYHNPKSPKVGWGHSTWQEGIKILEGAQGKRLAVFHHEPNHDDDTMDAIATEVHQVSPQSFVCRENMEVDVLALATARP